MKYYEILELKLLEEKRLIQEELEKFSALKRMPIVQENGQRRYGPSLEEPVQPPPRGSEIFVGKLPRDCNELDLIPALEKAGKIYDMRLMLNFSGNNRGYCFVQYSSPSEANRAVKMLNNYEIRNGCRIGVTKSVDNCRLFINKIPRDKEAHEIYEEIAKITEGVVNVHIKKPFDQNSSAKNRGHALVEYENHRSAVLAMRKLVSENWELFGRSFSVDWADPELESTVLIVENLSHRTPESVLSRMFNDLSGNGVTKVKKVSSRAYVNFRTPQHCQMAKSSVTNDIFLDGRKICVRTDKRFALRKGFISRRVNNVRNDFNFRTQVNPDKQTQTQASKSAAQPENKPSCWLPNPQATNFTPTSGVTFDSSLGASNDSNTTTPREVLHQIVSRDTIQPWSYDYPNAGAGVPVSQGNFHYIQVPAPPLGYGYDVLLRPAVAYAMPGTPTRDSSVLQPPPATPSFSFPSPPSSSVSGYSNSECSVSSQTQFDCAPNAPTFSNGFYPNFFPNAASFYPRFTPCY